MNRQEKMHLRGTFAELALIGRFVQEMVILTDSHGKVVWANRPFLDTCGYALSDLRGKKLGEVLQGPESDPAARQILHDALQSRRPCECRLINYRKDGSPYWVHISLGPVFEEGRLEGFLAVAQKLSATKS